MKVWIIRFLGLVLGLTVLIVIPALVGWKWVGISWIPAAIIMIKCDVER